MCKVTDERFNTPEKLRSFLDGCFSEKSAGDYYHMLTVIYEPNSSDGLYYYTGSDDGMLYMQVRPSDEPFSCLPYFPELTDVSKYTAEKLIDGRLQVRIPVSDPVRESIIMTFVYEKGEWKLDYYA